jgi:hypothetical protein
MQPTLDKANDTLDAINAPCVGFHGSVTCGPLAQLSQTEKNVGILAGQAALQVKQSATLVDSASAAVTSATADVHRMALAGTETLTEGKRTIAAAQPLLASLTRTSDASTLAIQHFDALVTSKDISEAISNIQFTTQNIGGVTADLRKVADKTTEDYLKPKTPWMKIGHALFNAYDLAAFAARHAP